MFRILLAILLLILPTQGWCVTQWNKAIPASGDNLTAWPAAIVSQWSIMDTLLSNYTRGESLVYKNATTLTVSSGEVVVSNSGASLRIFLQDASNTDITTANLDTGSSFSSSTTYYVYAGTSSATAASSTYYISLSSSAPSGVTYYKQLGNFITDGSGNIISNYGNITNNNVVSPPGLGAWTSKTVGTTYQASTDGFVTAYIQSSNNNSQLFGYTDSSASPTTLRAAYSDSSGASGVSYGSISFPVKKNDYYKVTKGTVDTSVMYFMPLGS